MEINGTHLMLGLLTQAKMLTLFEEKGVNNDTKLLILATAMWQVVAHDKGISELFNDKAATAEQVEKALAELKDFAAGQISELIESAV